MFPQKEALTNHLSNKFTNSNQEIKMDKERFERGLAARKSVLGAEYVEKALAKADDFNRDRHVGVVFSTQFGALTEIHTLTFRREPKFSETPWNSILLYAECRYRP